MLMLGSFSLVDEDVDELLCTVLLELVVLSEELSEADASSEQPQTPTIIENAAVIAIILFFIFHLLWGSVAVCSENISAVIAAVVPNNKYPLVIVDFKNQRILSQTLCTVCK